MGADRKWVTRLLFVHFFDYFLFNFYSYCYWLLLTRFLFKCSLFFTTLLLHVLYIPHSRPMFCSWKCLHEWIRTIHLSCVCEIWGCWAEAAVYMPLPGTRGNELRSWGVFLSVWRAFMCVWSLYSGRTVFHFNTLPWRLLTLSLSVYIEIAAFPRFVLWHKHSPHLDLVPICTSVTSRPLLHRTYVFVSFKSTRSEMFTTHQGFVFTEGTISCSCFKTFTLQKFNPYLLFDLKHFYPIIPQNNIQIKSCCNTSSFFSFQSKVAVPLSLQIFTHKAFIVPICFLFCIFLLKQKKYSWLFNFSLTFGNKNNLLFGKKSGFASATNLKRHNKRRKQALRTYQCLKW